MTRPDVAFHLGFLCQFMQDPSPQAYEAGLGVLSYLYQSKKIGLTYGGTHKFCPEPSADSINSVIAFGDASFGKTPYPYGGGFVWWRNAAVSWFARKPTFSPDSTCLAELNILVQILKEAFFVTNLSEDLLTEINMPHVISDSKSAIDIVRNPGTTKRSIHYERWLYFARDAYLHNKAKFFLTGTDTMMADSMTKVVDRTKFFVCRNYMMNI